MKVNKFPTFVFSLIKSGLHCLFSGNINPETISQTVSVGEMLNMTVATTLEPLVWRKNGEVIIAWSYNNYQKTVIINSVSLQDAGIYECHQQNNRTGTHAIFQVIVRGKY